MFAKMRRHDRLLTASEAEQILEREEYGVLTLNGPEGFPHTVPMSYVWHRDAIWLHGAMTGTRVDALRKDGRASFCVVGPTRVIPEKFTTAYESVICHGHLREVHGEEAEAGLRALIRKYTPEHLEAGEHYLKKDGMNTCVMRLDVMHMTGKALR